MKKGIPSPIRWWGGKSNSLKYILPLIPEHQCYVEIFGGGGWVLFAKAPSQIEVYNDIDGKLVNFFRCLKYHPRPLAEEISTYLHSREMFETFQTQVGETCLQKAARFYFLLKQSFGGKFQNYGYAKTKQGGAKSNLQVKKLKELFIKAKERLDEVFIENLDFETLIRKYDGESVFFYCDPPYLTPGGEEYKHKFRLSDHRRLRDTLKGTRGRWLLSYNNCAYIRRLYKGFFIKPLKVMISKGVGKRDYSPELLIANYDISKPLSESYKVGRDKK